MYQNLGLKNEFINTLRNYTVMVFTAGDLNKIKDLFVKYDLLEVTQKLSFDNKKSGTEAITNLLGYLDENTCK